MLGLLFSLLMLYVTAGLAYYLYLVIKTYEVLELWTFKIDKTHVGIYRYPRWLLGWVYYAGVKFHGGK